MKCFFPILLVLVSVCSCRAQTSTVSMLDGEWVQLSGPIHLGDNNYGGQSFDNGKAADYEYCALVYLPHAAQTTILLSRLRNTEQPGNQLVIDGKPEMLPMTLSQDGRVSQGAQMSPVYAVQLDEGPHQICVEAGWNLKNLNDIDDFEWEALLLRADGIKPEKISVRVISPESFPDRDEE